MSYNLSTNDSVKFGFHSGDTVYSSSTNGEIIFNNGLGKNSGVITIGGTIVSSKILDISTKQKLNASTGVYTVSVVYIDTSLNKQTLSFETTESNTIKNWFNGYINKSNAYEILTTDGVPHIVLETVINNNGYDYVDLGLPSGTLWATLNIGTTSVEEYGTRFYWSEVSAAKSTNQQTAKYLQEDDAYGSRYMVVSGYKNQKHYDDNTVFVTADDDGHFPSQYDAANYNWKGDWKIPSYNQIKELVDNCNITFLKSVTIDGNSYITLGYTGYEYKLYRFTSKIDESKYIDILGPLVGAEAFYYYLSDDSDTACGQYGFVNGTFGNVDTGMAPVAYRPVINSVTNNVTKYSKFVTEAPTDGKIYNRKDGEWIEELIVSSSTNVVNIVNNVTSDSSVDAPSVGAVKSALESKSDTTHTHTAETITYSTGTVKDKLDTFINLLAYEGNTDDELSFCILYELHFSYGGIACAMHADEKNGFVYFRVLGFNKVLKFDLISSVDGTVTCKYKDTISLSEVPNDILTAWGEPPVDGSTYARKDGEWVKVTSSSSSSSSDDVNALMEKIFPLNVTATANNESNEIGTAIIPQIDLEITHLNKNAVPDASVVVSIPTSGTTVSNQKKNTTDTVYNIKRITGSSTDTGTYEIKLTVLHSGSSAEVDKNWIWTNYRYYGVLSSLPASTLTTDEYNSVVKSIIESGNTNSTTAYNTEIINKELSTSVTLGSKTSPITIPANCGYIFAVKTSDAIHVYDANFGEMTGFPTNTVNIQQQNYSTSSKTNDYVYVIIEPSEISQLIYIKNS